MNEVPIKPASTVVLCRKDTPWPSETLLVKRSPKAAFLPGAYVFPGGQVDLADYSVRLAENEPELLKRMASFFPLESETISAHVAAAIRETEEEAGVSLKAHQLWPISWWVTPAGEARRFDTWFFLGVSSKEELSCALPNNGELQQALRVHPKEALELYQKGQIFLAPPTRAILERMAMADSLEHFLSFVDQPLRPIHPQFITEAGQKLLVLPGHERHPEKLGLRFIMKTFYKFP